MKPHFDPVFYKRVYPDLRFLTEAQLQDHYIKHSKQERRLGSQLELDRFIKQLPYNFETDTYRSMYPDISNDDTLAKVHYYMHGHPENRIYNQPQLKDSNQKVKKIITQTYNKRIPKTSNISTISEVHFNIIIRTHNRPVLFNSCINSILSQTYTDINIVICAQDIQTSNYIFTRNDERFNIFQPKIINNDTHYYNDFCNQALQYCNHGWIIFIDDDNMLADVNTLTLLNKCIQESHDSTNILINDYIRADKILSLKYIHGLSVGELDTANFCIHESIKHLGEWPTHVAGDYGYFNKILNNERCHPQFSEIPAIQTQYTTKISGYGV